MRDVATGAANLTFSYPGLTTLNRTASNIGGYVFQDDIQFNSTVPIQMGGRIMLPNGTPAAGAFVRMIVGNVSVDGAEDAFEATTDANGYYTFDLSANPPDGTKTVWVVASKAGYQSAYVSNRPVGVAGKTNFNLTLGREVPVVEVGRTTTAPTIDGVVNTAEWSKSAKVTQFYAYPTDGTAAVGSAGYALWDNDNLYLAMVGTEPNTSGLKSDNTGRDTSAPNTVWADDNFEFFLDPKKSAAIGYGYEVWQIGMNARTTDIGYSDGTIRKGPFAQGLRTVEDRKSVV